MCEQWLANVCVGVCICVGCVWVYVCVFGVCGCMYVCWVCVNCADVCWRGMCRCRRGQVV